MKSKVTSSLVPLLILSLGVVGSGCAGKTVKNPSPTTPSQAEISSTAIQAPAKAEIVSLVGSSIVHRYTLDNGLRLLVVEDHSSPTFAYQTWFRVGSRDEQPGRTGLAHLFEHMMFKETKTLREGEFDKILEAAGAEGENAFTSRDYTAYVQELPSDKLELIARLEADRMVNLIVNESAFKTETEVVQNERRFRNENSPEGLMYQEIFELAFNKHSYRWPVIGYEQDLAAMTGADAEKFYRSFYSPNHATIVIVGDVTPERAYQVVSKHYALIPAQPSPVNLIPEEPPQTAPRRKVLKLNMQVEKLMMGYRIPSVLSEEIPALWVTQAVLSGGKSSRLHRALVETGIASSVSAYSLDDKDPSLFMFQVELQKGKNAAQAESVLLRELQRLAKEAPAAAEIERAKNRLNFDFYSSLDSNSEKANFIGHYESIAKGFEAGLAIQAKVMTVSAQDVQAITKRYLQPKNRSVIVGVPK